MGFLQKKKRNKNSKVKHQVLIYIIVKTSMYIASQRMRGNGLLQCKHSLL